MHSKLGRKFDRIVRWLKKRFPTNTGFPVTVRTVENLVVDGEECWGVSDFYPGHGWVIQFDRKCIFALALDTLLHEMAHALDLEKSGWAPEHAKQHGPSWGIIFSSLYSAYHHEFRPLDKERHPEDYQ